MTAAVQTENVSAAPAVPPPGPVSIAVVAQSLVCAAGSGLQALAQALRDNRSALEPCSWGSAQLPTWVGAVAGLDAPSANSELPAGLHHWDCRATRLAWRGLQADGFAAAAQAACQRFGPARVGLVLGTSASTIEVSERAYRQLDGQGHFPAALRQPRLNTLHALTDFVQQALGLQGPCVTVSTACSSSAKAYAQGARWLQLGLVDAVVVGGVDALCDSIVYGFAALQLVSAQACQPFGAQRQGISVGEAAGFALLQRGSGRLQLLGWGESNDAHHMSSPHPQGLGAERALDAALQMAQLDATALGFVSLHGTGTALNDSVEAALVARRYAVGVHAAATKGCTGHTMGAAGVVSAMVCSLALQQGLYAGTPGTLQVDPALPEPFAQQLRLQPAWAPKAVLQPAALHAFGFGGNNAVLIFGRGS